MRRLFTFFSLVGAVVLLAIAGIAQDSPRGKSELTLGNAKASVEYGRPSLRGRTVQDMLKELSPGDVWRLGADDSTTFSTTGDLVFGNSTVPKGDYSLWARKESDGSWKLVFNTQHGQYGTEHDPTKDLVATPLKESKLTNPVEQVTIGLTKQGSGGEIKIEWGNLQLASDFKAK